MSLINDALKRATRTQPTTIPIDPEPAAPMQPVEYRRRGLPWYFFPSLLVILAAACWFIVKGVQAKRESSNPVPKPVTVQARQTAPETPASVSASAVATEVPPTTPAKATSTLPPSLNSGPSPDAGPATTETPATTPSAAPAPPPEPAKPTYKLQGIFFRPENPSAMVNGRSVWVGSRVDGATVKTITRDSLTIEVNGQTSVLTLE